MRTSTRSRLLLGAEEAGLELLTQDGRWIPVSPKPGELVINIGDMLQRLTNGRLRSTSHRVVNPAPDRASKARYSMPFFLHFRSDFLIEALPGDGARRASSRNGRRSPPTTTSRSGCGRSSWSELSRERSSIEGGAHGYHAVDPGRSCRTAAAVRAYRAAERPTIATR